MVQSILILTKMFRSFLYSLLYAQATLTRSIAKINSTKRRISSASSSSNAKNKNEIVYSRCESDSHADTTAAGANCVILNYTGKMCDVSAYRDDYEAVRDVPIVNAATAWQSCETGQTYILVFNEALWMGDSMKSTLFNPNQLRHYGTKVQDNPVSENPLSIISDDDEFCLELSMDGTIVYFDSHTPTEEELLTCPHIVLSSPHPWDPAGVTFPKIRRTLEEEIGGVRFISGFSSSFANNETETDDFGTSIFNLSRITRKISSMKLMPESEMLTCEKDFTISPPDVPVLPTFQSSNRHSDVSAENISERRGISLPQAAKTLKATTQKFLRSATLPLSRRYRADRMFHRKTLKGEWSTDTMDGRCTSLDGNNFAQVFANRTYFAKIYPMNSKSKAGDALKLFCQEFGVPEKLTFDGSKEQGEKGTTFMKEVRKQGIDYHISEPSLHNQNPVEAVIGEIRRKWYRTMVRKRVPRQLWDYGVTWVAEIMSITHSAAGDIKDVFHSRLSLAKQQTYLNIWTLAFMIESGLKIMLDCHLLNLVDGWAFLTVQGDSCVITF